MSAAKFRIKQQKRRAKELDALHHAGEPNVERRPILRRLVSFPRVRGDCVGAFAEFSGALHALLEETASAACDRHWRTAGAFGHIAGRLEDGACLHAANLGVSHR